MKNGLLFSTLMLLMLGSVITPPAFAAGTNVKGKEHAYTQSMTVKNQTDLFWIGTKTLFHNGHCEKLTQWLVKITSVDGLQVPVIAAHEQPCSK